MQMAEIQIDQEKAARLIAQILREEKKLQPAEANDLATNMCRRLYAAMPHSPEPRIAGLSHDQAISA
jgi:hypothetical protein